MNPGTLVFLIPIIAILGGCSVAITKLILNARDKSLSSGQVKQLMTRMQTLDADNKDLKKQVDDLRLIATEDFHALPPATDQMIEQKIEQIIQRKNLLNEK